MARTRPTYRYELLVRKEADKQLKKQHEFFIDNRKELYDRVGIWYFTPYGKELQNVDEEKVFESMAEFRDAMGLGAIAENIRGYVERTLKLGYKTGYRTHIDDMFRVGIDFSLQNPVVQDYMRRFDRIQLSERKGSISFTTKNAVVRELRRGMKESLTVDQIARNIRDLDATTFSLNRAKVIAIRETGVAYATGNRIPMVEAKRQGAYVEKMWETVRDDRVTERCHANQEEGRIELDQTWGSGDMDTPRDTNLRCRCTTKYEISFND